MSIDVNIDINKWLRDIEISVNKVEGTGYKVFKEVSETLFNTIVSATPVGDPSLWKYPAPKNYRPGTLKASWELELDRDAATIKNEQPYSQRVEYGWSTQAPAGMVRISIKQLPDIINKVAKDNKI